MALNLFLTTPLTSSLPTKLSLKSHFHEKTNLYPKTLVCFSTNAQPGTTVWGKSLDFDPKIAPFGNLRTTHKRIQWRVMAKGKNARDKVTLECTSCRSGVNKGSKGVSRYTTQKNRQNTPDRLELKKFCPYCNGHTVHGEIKK